MRTLLVLLLVFAATAVADTIVLKNNREIKGVILSADKDDDYVELMIPQVGKMKFHKRDIAEIIWNNDDGTSYVEEFERDRPVGSSPADPEAGDEGDESGEPGAEEGTDETEEGADAPKILGDIEVADPPSPTSDERQDLDLWMRRLGDMRRRGGAGTRRILAVKELTRMGGVAVPRLTSELSSGNLWARRNAYLVFADLGAKTDQKKYLWEKIPNLIDGIGDEDYLVRANANKALESLTGKRKGYPGALEGPPSADERKTQQKWREFWTEVEPEIQAAREEGAEGGD